VERPGHRGRGEGTGVRGSAVEEGSREKIEKGFRYGVRSRGLLLEGKVLDFTRLRSTRFSLPVLQVKGGRRELFLPTPGISP